MKEVFQYSVNIRDNDLKKLIEAGVIEKIGNCDSLFVVSFVQNYDELVGLKQPDAPPISSPVEDTLNSYSELLKEKDDRIKELIEDKKVIRKEKYKVMWMLVVIVTAIFAWFIIDIMNGHFGAFRY